MRTTRRILVSLRNPIAIVLTAILAVFLLSHGIWGERFHHKRWSEPDLFDHTLDFARGKPPEPIRHSEYVALEPDGPRVVDNDDASEGDLWTWAAQNNIPVYQVFAIHEDERLGFFAITEQRLTHRFLITPIPDPLMRPLIESSMLDWMRDQHDPSIGTFMDRYDTVGPYARTIRWQGYVYNAVTLVVLLAFVVSLGWIPPAIARRRQRRLERRRAQNLAAGLCPHCRYPIAGLAAPTCPECGETVISPPTIPPATPVRCSLIADR
jgi:hypothetical protein